MRPPRGVAQQGRRLAAGGVHWLWIVLGFIAAGLALWAIAGVTFAGLSG